MSESPEHPGLHQKYRVTRQDGSPCPPEAEYLVLRLDKDRAARSAALHYADQTRNTELARDLRAWVQRHDPDAARRARRRLQARLLCHASLVLCVLDLVQLAWASATGALDLLPKLLAGAGICATAFIFWRYRHQEADP